MNVIADHPKVIPRMPPTLPISVWTVTWNTIIHKKEYINEWLMTAYFIFKWIEYNNIKIEQNCKNHLIREQVQLCLFMPGYDLECCNIIKSNKLHRFFFNWVIRINARWCTWTAFPIHRYHFNNDTFIACGHWQNARIIDGFSSCVKYWNLQRKKMRERHF